ncbi:ion channel [Zhouia sp. PK063]|uniref:ion channel n=1 Tax=Zhouia sp. PK063 TaxID=3373602 RepID=UPI0037B8E757
MAFHRKQKYNDLGLDTKSACDKSYRALNKNGSFNVVKKNVSFLERLNSYHSLVSMPWLHFFGVILLGYFCINIVFALLYMLIGVHHLTGITATTPLTSFMEAFFFSAQTITTLGYGRVAPVGMFANIVAASESMLGLLTFALATGLMYGRFSKPTPAIKYSDHAVMAPYQNGHGFMFRIVNPKKNELLEVEVTLTLSLKKQNDQGRDFHLLEVERNKVSFFPTMWTVVHPISTESPLHEITAEEMLSRGAEFIVIIKAFDESFSQTVYSRTSYIATEIKWNERFVYLTEQFGNGLMVDVSRINETEKTHLT